MRDSRSRDDPDRLRVLDDEVDGLHLNREPATERMYQRLVEELKRLDKERRVDARRATPAIGRVTRGRELAAKVAVFLTGLSILALALRYVPPIFHLDPILGRPGRSYLSSPFLPLVPLWASVVAWGVWALIVVRQKRPPQKRPRLGRPWAKPHEGSAGNSAKPKIGRRVVREMRPYLSSIGFLFLASLSAVPLTLITPLPLKLIVDNVVGSQPLPGYLGWLTQDPSAVPKETVVAIAIGILLVGTVLTNLQNLANIWLTNRVGNRMTLDMRVRLFHQLQRLSTTFHDTKGTIDSTYRIQNDATALRSLTTDGLVPLVTALLSLGGMIVVTTSLDWQLALIALAVAPFMFLFTLAYRPRIRIGWRKVKSSESAAMSAAQESLSAARVVKAFGQEERERKQFRSRYKETASAALKVMIEGALYTMVIGVVMAIGVAAVLFIGIQHVQAGTLSLGGLLMVNYYLTQLYSPLRDVGKKYLDIQNSMAGMERFLEILDEEADVPEKVDARPLARASGPIAFRDVSFGYDPSRLVLRNVSFDLPTGTCLGVVGPTGCGKTTLANLLVRFFDPTAGAITLDGIDLRDYKVADLRNQFAVVLQDTLLFSTTIAENIRFARPEATEDEIVAAAKLANAHDFITGLPEGYDSQVGDRGLKLSGGERQRISLARAFLKDAPILILDEPTSALDLHAEATILDGIQRLMEGRTTLMIAHRPSTLRACNAILLLEPNGNSRLTDEVASSLERMAAVGLDGSANAFVDEGAH
jgi:ATP-binding cassette, subfamily B, bacterial